MSNNQKSSTTNGFKKTLKTLLTMVNHRKQVKKRFKRVTLNVAVLGHKSVGKTSLIKTICGYEFDKHYTPTVHDVYEKECMFGSSYVKLEFIDLAGAYSFPAMTRLYIEKADVYLLVYDGTEESYEALTRLKTEIERLRKLHISELSVAAIKSKCDSNRRLKKRSEMDEKIARWCRTVFYCSARTATNIAEIEDYLISESLFADTPPTSPCSRSGQNRLSGRYIYGGRRHSKSLILNRTTGQNNSLTQKRIL